MKDSKVYAEKFKKWFASTKRKADTVSSIQDGNPIELLIRGMISEILTERQTDAVMKKMNEYFVDFNDLRVSRQDEMIEVLGQDNEKIRQMSKGLGAVLNAIYNIYEDFNLEPLKKMGKRPSRQWLEDLDGISPFAVNYCMLIGFQSHAIPLNDRMIQWLKKQELVHAEANPVEIEGFILKQISAKETLAFYALLRSECEGRSKSGRSTSATSQGTSTRKKKTVRKTKKRTRSS